MTAIMDKPNTTEMTTAEKRIMRAEEYRQLRDKLKGKKPYKKGK